MSTVMWEARAADGRLDDLVAHVVAHADPSAQVFRSDRGEPRVVLLDPTGNGLSDVPADLLARPPHSWLFDAVQR